MNSGGPLLTRASIAHLALGPLDLVLIHQRALSRALLHQGPKITRRWPDLVGTIELRQRNVALFEVPDIQLAALVFARMVL